MAIGAGQHSMHNTDWLYMVCMPNAFHADGIKKSTGTYTCGKALLETQFLSLPRTVISRCHPKKDPTFRFFITKCRVSSSCLFLCRRVLSSAPSASAKRQQLHQSIWETLQDWTGIYSLTLQNPTGWSRTREVSNVPKPAVTKSVKLSTVACRCLMGWYRIEGLSNHNPIKHQATRILSRPSLHCLLIALWQAAALCDNTFCTCLKSRCSCYSLRFSGNKGQPPRKSENHMHVFPSLAR
jgi:hypothetical protein